MIVSPRGASRFALAALIALGALCLFANREQPLVRNGLVYARACEHVIEHGFDPLPVVADSRLSYDKPIGFAWFASPLVAWLGTHKGLMLASFLGTLAYLFATAFFARVHALDERESALLLLFACAGPIVAYQFWSAHPDGLFAALYISACALCKRLLRAPSVAGVTLLFATIFAALVFKNYGLILIPSCAAYFVWNRRALLAHACGRRVAAAIALTLLVLATLVILGRTGHNPLMRIEGEGGGAGQYGRGVWLRSSYGTWLQVGVLLFVNVHVALPLVVRARGWRATESTERGSLLSSIVCFPLFYIAGLMLFPTTFYNMRYFVTLLPFVALLAVLGLRRCGAFVQRALPASFAAIALFAIAVFNWSPLYARVGERLPRWQVDWLGPQLSFLDNLRMPLHRKQAAVLDNLNRKVEPHGIVYMLDVFYYGDAQQGVYERAGLIRADIETRYVGSRELAPQEPSYYVLGPVRDPKLLPRLGRVTDLQQNLYRIDAQTR